MILKEGIGLQFIRCTPGVRLMGFDYRELLIEGGGSIKVHQVRQHLQAGVRFNVRFN